MRTYKIEALLGRYSRHESDRSTRPTNGECALTYDETKNEVRFVSCCANCGEYRTIGSDYLSAALKKMIAIEKRGER